MAIRPLSDETLRQTVAYYDAAHGNATKAARLMGVGRETFAARLREARRRLGIVAPTTAPDAGIARRAAEAEELGQARKEIEILRKALTDKAAAPKPAKVAPGKPRSARRDITRVILPDIHSTYADPGAIAAVLADIKALDPDEVIQLGDAMDCGGFLAAHHVLGYVPQLDEVSYEADLNAWGTILNAITAAAPRAKITLLEGNHEQRVEKWAVQQALGHGKNADFLRRAIAPEFRLGYAGRGIRYIRYGEIYDGLPVRGTIRLGKCFFTHGFALGAKAAENHARKIGGCVVYGHTHQAASHFSKTVNNGVQAAWNFGCLASFAPRYMHTNPDSWLHGYGIQQVAPSGHFSTVHVPIIKGVSYLPRIK